MREQDVIFKLCPGLLCLAQLAAAIQVQILQPDGFKTENSGLRRSGLNLTSPDLTFCIAFNPYYINTDLSSLVSYATDDDDNALVINLPKFHHVLMCLSNNIKSACVESKVEMTLRSWYHYCFTVESKAGGVEIDFYQNGVAKSITFEANFSTSAIRTDGILILGQEQDSVGGDLDSEQSFSGKIGYFNAWNRSLSQEEILGIQNCSTETNGNLVQWNGTWEGAAETKTIFEDYAELCTANESIGLLVINRKVRYNEFLELCNYVDGELPVVTSAQATNAQRAFLRDKLTQDQDLGNCIINRDELGYWSAQTRDPVTKDWINPYNNSVLGKWPFPGFDGDDDLLTEDFNCLRVWGANIKIAKCMSEGACGFCFLKQKNQTLTLKGIRDEDVYDNNEFDREYYPFGYRNQHIIFQGLMNSYIFFDLEENNWILQSIRFPNKFYKMDRGDDDELPIGRKMWQKIDGDEEIIKVVLTLSTCGIDKFTCDSGQCVTLIDHCNLEIDCKDRSDERECDYLQQNYAYQKQLIPRDSSKTPVQVAVNMTILSIPVIRTVGLVFSVDFLLGMQWRDLRLVFNNINDDVKLNQLAPEEVERIWAPRLGFFNALGDRTTEVDKNTKGVVVMEGKPLKYAPYLAYETLQFAGHENSVYFEREYYHDFTCKFDLLYFPFDTQVCHIILNVKDYAMDFINLTRQDVQGLDAIRYAGEREQIEYTIVTEKLRIRTTEDNVSQAIVTVVLERNTAYHLANTVLQIAILLMISFMSFYFDFDNFSDRIMMTLTTMLVITTILSSIQEDLPKTSYYKLMDWWLLISVNSLVYSMAAHTYLAKVIKNEKSEMDKTEVQAEEVEEGRDSPGTPESREDLSSSRSRKNHWSVMEKLESKNRHGKVEMVNQVGKWGFVAINVMSNLIIGLVAMVERFKEPNEYVEAGYEMI